MGNLELEINWTVPTGLAAFEGHFPAQPVLPAYAILDFSLDCIARASGSPARLRAVDSAKFTQPLAPGDGVRIFLKSRVDGEWEVGWQRAGASVAELRLRLER